MKFGAHESIGGGLFNALYRGQRATCDAIQIFNKSNNQWRAAKLQPDDIDKFFELIEETGYSAAKWKKLGEITPVPGYSDERIHLYLAQELTIRQQNLDVDEVLDVFTIDFNEAMAMIHREEIQDGKTLAGLYMAFHWLGSISEDQPFGNST